MNFFLAVFIIVNLLLVGRWQTRQRYRAWIYKNTKETRAMMDQARRELGEILLPSFLDLVKVINDSAITARDAAEGFENNRASE